MAQKAGIGKSQFLAVFRQPTSLLPPNSNDGDGWALYNQAKSGDTDAILRYKNYYNENYSSDVKNAESAPQIARELKGIINFKLAPRVQDQLMDSRLGRLAGQLDEAKLNQLLNSPNAQRFLDVNSGHINVIQQVDNVLLRITVTRDDFKIISVGPIKQNGVTNGIENARFIPLN